MAGIKGARIILERKFNKKIPVIKRIGPIVDIKGWSVLFSVTTVSS
jgi:hypothetical protein